MRVAVESSTPREPVTAPHPQARRVMVVIQYFHEDKLGAYRRLANFLEENRQWRFLVPSHRTEGAWTAWGGEEGNLEVVRIPPRWPNRGQFFGWLRYAKQYLSCLEEAEPPVSVVYVVAPPAWWVLPAAWAARRHRVPCVLDLGDAAEGQAKGLWQMVHVAAERLLRKWSRRVIVASPDLIHGEDRFIMTGITQQFFDVGEQRLAQVNLGPTPEPHVFYCGTFSELQNLDFVLESWGGLLERIPRARLTLVGRGPSGEEEQLKALAERLRLGDRAVFHDRMAPEAIPPLLVEADWGLVSLDPRPELDYAVPTKMMEYFAAALPVLGMGGGRVRQTLEESGGGRWVDPVQLATPEGKDDLARVLTADRQPIADKAYAFARAHCDRETYQREINLILRSTITPWTEAVERAVAWLEKEALLGPREVGEGRMALRHSLAPSRIERADRWGYPEGTAYGLSLYVGLYRIDPRPEFLERARAMARWLIDGLTEEGGLPFVYDLDTHRFLRPCYSFDTAMAVRAWMLLDRVDPNPLWREAAERAGRWLVERMQQPDGSFLAVEPGGDTIPPEPAPACYYGSGGALHIKHALPLRDLAGPRLENEAFHTALRRLVAWGIMLVNREGAFPIGRGTESINSHTHSYALEGLSCMPELRQSWRKGVAWSANRVTRQGWMPSGFVNGSPEPKAGIDASSQTLRLIALALRDVARDNPVLRRAGERIARSLRAHQRPDGGWAEFADSPPQTGPPVWPTLFAVSALMFWEREDLGAEYLF